MYLVVDFERERERERERILCSSRNFWTWEHDNLYTFILPGCNKYANEKAHIDYKYNLPQCSVMCYMKYYLINCKNDRLI